MDSPYTIPPAQPKWLLNLQVWLLRHRLMGPMGRQFMVITTTGRKTGKQHSVPIGFARDGDTVLAFNTMDHSNWLWNLRVNPRVSLNIDGREFPAVGHEEATDTPEKVHAIVDVYYREQPDFAERFLKVPPNATNEQLAMVGEHLKFVRFVPDDGL